MFTRDTVWQNITNVVEMTRQAYIYEVSETSQNDVS